MPAKKTLSVFLCILVASFLSCGGRQDTRDDGIDGTYVYQDNICRSTITVSGDSWRMKTQFGAPGFYGSPEYDSGKVKGETLYHSGVFAYGKVRNGTIRVAGRRYEKR